MPGHLPGCHECARALVPASRSEVHGHLISALHFPTFPEHVTNKYVLFVEIFSQNYKEKYPSLYQAAHMKRLQRFSFRLSGLTT